MRALLEVRNLSKHFDGVAALSGVSLHVETGEIVGLMGPNGAGKTTLFNCVTGALKPDRGSVHLDGQEITGLPPHSVAQRGLARTFQLIRPFAEMTVLQNVLCGQPHARERLWGVALRRTPKALEERAWGLLEFFGLDPLAHQPAGELSYGQQKLLTLATALMQAPKVILLDEPFSGVNPTMIERILERLQRLNAQGMTFLVIEHNMEALMRLAQRVYALAAGRVIAEGTPKEIQQNPEVLEVYYGQ
jgi:branched-chain amino acid transport system ATP-binding protein